MLVTWLPDVESVCEIRRIEADVPASGNQPCYWGGAVLGGLAEHYIWSFEAVAGNTYAVQVSGNLAAEMWVTIWDYDGRQHGNASYGAASVTAPVTGRYYIVLEHRFGGVEHSVLLTNSGP